jgi:hypothetical protein
MATEEGQTGNVFDTIHFNLTDEASLLSQIPGVDPGLTKNQPPRRRRDHAVDRLVLVEGRR